MLIDFHSHILPGIDDGSASLEESIGMLQMEARQGVTHVVATPHFYAQYDDPEHFLDRRVAAAAALQTEMANYEGLPQVSLGAEVYYFQGISDCQHLSRLTMGAGNGILIELPLAPWPESVYRELQGIWEKQRLIPVIAHIDRYIRPFQTFQIPKRLAMLPVLVQANASFFYERATAKMAMRMLRAEQIQLIGSDCHGSNFRKPDMEDAVAQILRTVGQEGIERIRSFERSVLKL